MAQLAYAPVLTAEKVPGGTSRGSSSEDRLWPQHASVPTAPTPQVVFVPALTAANAPRGALVSPTPFAPQHASVPSGLTAHVCSAPALTASTARLDPPTPEVGGSLASAQAGASSLRVARRPSMITGLSLVSTRTVRVPWTESPEPQLSHSGMSRWSSRVGDARLIV